MKLRVLAHFLAFLTLLFCLAEPLSLWAQETNVSGTNAVSAPKRKAKELLVLTPQYIPSEVVEYPFIYPCDVQFEKALALVIYNEALEHPSFLSSHRSIPPSRKPSWANTNDFLKRLRNGARNTMIVVGEMLSDATVNAYDGIKTPRIILCGYKDITPEFQKKYPRITGLVLIPSHIEMINLGLKLMPKTKTVAVITDDVDTDPDIHKELLGKRNSFKNCNLLLINASEYTTQQMLEKLDQLPKESFIVYSHWRNFNRDGFSTVTEVTDKIAATGHPFFTLSNRPFPKGSMGGYIFQGKTCAEKSLKLISQTFKASPDEIIPPFRTRGELVIDMKIFEKFGLDDNLLPYNAILLNPRPPIWQAYREEVIITLVSFGIVCLLTILLYILYFRLKRSKKALNLALKEAQQANAAKDYFISLMSHELRTPLNSIMGFSNLMQEMQVSSELTEYSNSIYQSGLELLEIIETILDFSKWQSDEIKITLKKGDPLPFFRENFYAIEPLAQRKNLELIWDCSINLPLLYMDWNLLQKMLRHLLSNAVKFTHAGSIKLSVHFEPTGEKSGTLDLQITDTGIGISEEEIKTIFAPFIQVDMGGLKGKRAYGGMGLGLSIVKKLVPKMNGILSVQSKIKQGSTFRILFHQVSFEPRTPHSVENSRSPSPSPKESD